MPSQRTLFHSSFFFLLTNRFLGVMHSVFVSLMDERTHRPHGKHVEHHVFSARTLHIHFLVQRFRDRNWQ